MNLIRSERVREHNTVKDRLHYKQNARSIERTNYFLFSNIVNVFKNKKQKTTTRLEED